MVGTTSGDFTSAYTVTCSTTRDEGVDASEQRITWINKRF